MMLCSEVAMTDAGKESEARCTAMLSQLISAVKKQTLEMEDLAVCMDELAVGLKAIVQPLGAPAHALPPLVPAPTATCVTVVDHAVAAATPCAEAALAPESPTKCSTSGPDTNAGYAKGAAVPLLSRGATTALRAHAEPMNVSLSKSFDTGELDTVTPTRCSTACRGCNTNMPSTYSQEVAPTPHMTTGILGVTITSPAPSIGAPSVCADTCIITGRQVFEEMPGKMYASSDDPRQPVIAQRSDDSRVTTHTTDIVVDTLKFQWPPPEQGEIARGRAELRPMPTRLFNCYQGGVPRMPPWPPPQGQGTLLELFHKQAGIKPWMMTFTNAEMGVLNSLVHGVIWVEQLLLLYLDYGEFQSFGVVYGDLSTSPLYVYKSALSERLDMGPKPDHFTYAAVLDTCANLATIEFETQIHGQIIKQEMLGEESICNTMPSQFGKLPNLQYLDISGNNWNGSIPESLGSCTMIWSLKINNNSLSGNLPKTIGNLVNLQIILDLSNNKLSGGLPQQFGNLVMLEFLNLSHNQFHGGIPLSFTSMASMSVLDVSYNNLEGPVPVGIGRIPPNNSEEWFIHNKGLCSNLYGLPPCYSTLTSKHHKVIPNRLILSVVIPTCVVILLTIVAGFMLVQIKRKPHEIAAAERTDVFSVWNFNGKLAFEDITRATENFDDKYMVGTGGYGSVYKAQLQDGQLIAVKKLHPTEEELDDGRRLEKEIEDLTRIRQRSIVKLYGFCFHPQYKFLVYDYMERGSLHKALENGELANGTGYRCNCSEGFAGNPCLQGPGGCQDEKNYPCTHKYINRVGGFNCTCQMGMTGDGKKQGTRCNRDTTLVITVGGGLALLVVLLMLCFWTYWLVKKRRLAKQKQQFLLQNGDFSYRMRVQQRLNESSDRVQLLHLHTLTQQKHGGESEAWW